jgi:hypothetical protein
MILIAAARKETPIVPFPTLADPFRFVFLQSGGRGADGRDVSGYSTDGDPRSGSSHRRHHRHPSFRDSDRGQGRDPSSSGPSVSTLGVEHYQLISGSRSPIPGESYETRLLYWHRGRAANRCKFLWGGPMAVTGPRSQPCASRSSLGPAELAASSNLTLALVASGVGDLR